MFKLLQEGICSQTLTTEECLSHKEQICDNFPFVTYPFPLSSSYSFLSPCLRLHAGHGAIPARADPSPHPVSVRQKGPGALHCLLDPESLCTLGGLPAPRLTPQTANDRAS